MSNENKELNRKKRGQISKKDLETYSDYKSPYLIEMLNDDDPQIRTIAATLLGDKENKASIEPLCASIKKENALYSRIAMSEALGKMGEDAVPQLIKLLGQMGSNQEIELPKKYFNKKSFPLARDMAARTIIKIGKPATPYLVSVVTEENLYISQQAIDALGGIATKTGDERASPLLIRCLEKYSDDDLTLWKIIRSLSAFKNVELAINPLLNIIQNYKEPAIIWEATKTLGQIGIKRPDVMNAISKLEKNDNSQVKISAKNALINLNNQNQLKNSFQNYFFNFPI